MKVVVKMPQSWKAIYNLMRDVRFAIKDFRDGEYSTIEEFDREIQYLKSEYSKLTFDTYAMIVYLITDYVNITMQDYKISQYDEQGKDKLDKLSKELLTCMKLQWKLQLRLKNIEGREKLMSDIVIKTRFFNKQKESLYTTVGLFLLSRAALILNPSIAQCI